MELKGNSCISNWYYRLNTIQ